MNEKLASHRLWRGWKEDCSLLALIVGTLIFEHFFGKSNLANAVLVSLLLCLSLIYTAASGKNPGKWNPFHAWVVRFGAVVCGCWLFMATPTLTRRLTAVILFAVLYVLSEQFLSRRVHAIR